MDHHKLLNHKIQIIQMIKLNGMINHKIVVNEDEIHLFQNKLQNMIIIDSIIIIIHFKNHCNTIIIIIINLYHILITFNFHPNSLIFIVLQSIFLTMH